MPNLPEPVLFGAAYYHEYQPSPRLDEDLDLMVEAGFSVIRVGESTWSTWEPEDGHFDLVVSDQSMPGLSGEQLARAITELAPGTPFILLTGFGDEMQARGQLPVGISLIVGKPVTASDLRRAVLQASTHEEPPMAAVAA